MHGVRSSRRRRVAGSVAAIRLAVAFTLAACVGAGAAFATRPATHYSAAAAMGTMPGMTGMAGMSGPMPTGDGLAGSISGLAFTLAASATTLPADQPVTLHFKVTDSAGMPVTSFVEDQTKLMHLYVVRSDLTGYQHVHPVMATDGTWNVGLSSLQAGSYRAYAAFTATPPGRAPAAVVLSEPFTVVGAAASATLPAAARSTKVDGYTVTMTGVLTAGKASPLTATVARNGIPVSDLQPYLGTYGHLTALHEGDLAFAHLHPQGKVAGDLGGPTLEFDALLPEPGNYRMFLQFQTGGVVHTAAITLDVQ